MKQLFLRTAFRLCLTCLLLFSSGGMLPGAIAQEKAKPLAVKGIVTDEKGNPLPGAVVMVEGTKNATTTDLEGKFSLKVQKGKTLSFQFMGYQTVTQTVTNLVVYNIQLKPDTQALDEVIVTALGLKREKRSLGYAATEVSGDEIATVQSANWLSGLQGKVAGVQFNSASSGPITSQRVVVRGETSLSGNSSALFVIDGVPMTSGQISNSSGGLFTNNDSPVDFGDGATDLNPEEIESVTVLKGAAATALYGSRAGNGAIIITTKTGKDIKGLGVTFNSAVTFDAPGYWPEFQTVYGSGQDNGVTPYNFWGNSFVPGSGSRFASRHAYGEKFDSELLRYQYNSYNWDTGEFTPTPWVYHDDWYKGIYRTGMTLDNSVTIEGGNGKGSNARLSIKDSRNEWILPNTGYEKKSLSFSFRTKVNKRFTLSSKVSYYVTESDNMPAAGYSTTSLPYILIWGRNSDSMQDLYNEYFLGRYNSWSYENYSYLVGRNAFYNPYRTLYEFNNTLDRRRLMGNVTLGIKISDKLNLDIRTGLDNNQEFRTQRKPKYSDEYPEGWYREQVITFSEINTDFILKYSDSFFNDDLSLSANFGGNNMTYKRNTWKYTISKIDLEGIYNTSNYPADVIPLINTYRSDKVVNSLYGMVSLGWKDMAYLDITARNDWSSTLARGHWSYFYPSLSGSLLLDKVFNFQDNAPWITFLKLRASWANVGKDTSPYSLDYPYSSTPFSGGYRPSATAPKIDLEPENVETFEVGVEAKFLQNRISMDLAIYQSNITDQIYDVPYDWMTGTLYYTENIGLIQNRGIEFSANFIPIRTRDVKWNIGFNLSSNIGVLMSMYDGWDNNVPHQEDIGANIGGRYFVYDYVGRRMGEIWALGLQKLPEGSYYIDEAGNKVDCSGQRVIDASTGMPLLDSTPQYFGNVNPDLTGGLSTSLKFRQFSLSANFTFQVGGKAYSVTDAQLTSGGKTTRTLEGRYDGLVPQGYNITGYDAEGNAICTPNKTLVTNMFAYYFNYDAYKFNFEPYIHSTSFFKMKELRLEYALSKKILKKTKVLQGASIAAYATNLFCISEWPQYDPEIATMNGSNIVRGLESGSFPMCRSYGANIKLNF